jgi:hypothetical protein
MFVEAVGQIPTYRVSRLLRTVRAEFVSNNLMFSSKSFSAHAAEIKSTTRRPASSWTPQSVSNRETIPSLALNAPIRSDANSREYLFQEIDDAETPLLARKVLADQKQIAQTDIELLLAAFKDAKALGSLLRVSAELRETLQRIECRLRPAESTTHVSKPARAIAPGALF